MVSFLFLASYPQDRRSYYLFFNYLFFNYLYVLPVWYTNRGVVLPVWYKTTLFRLPVWYWITPSNHRHLWISLTEAIA